MKKSAAQLQSDERGKRFGQYKKQLIKRITPAEKHLLTLLKFLRSNKNTDRIRPRYRFQKGLYKGDGFAIIDFYFPGTHSCIELDGGYHYTPEGIAKDKWRDAYIMRRGLNVFHVRNEIVLTWGLDELIKFMIENKIVNPGGKIPPRTWKPVYI